MAAIVASLDAKRTIPQRLENLGISTRFFAELVGSSQSEVSKFLNEKPLGGQRTIEWKKALDELEKVAEMFEPIGGVIFRSPQQAKGLILACREKPEAAVQARQSLDALAGALAVLLGVKTEDIEHGNAARTISQRIF